VQQQVREKSNDHANINKKYGIPSLPNKDFFLLRETYYWDGEIDTFLQFPFVDTSKLSAVGFSVMRRLKTYQFPPPRDTS
jgi:hypothetical protein